MAGSYTNNLMMQNAHLRGSIAQAAQATPPNPQITQTPRGQLTTEEQGKLKAQLAGIQAAAVKANGGRPLSPAQLKHVSAQQSQVTTQYRQAALHSRDFTSINQNQPIPQMRQGDTVTHGNTPVVVGDDSRFPLAHNVSTIPDYTTTSQYQAPDTNQFGLTNTPISPLIAPQFGYVGNADKVKTFTQGQLLDLAREADNTASRDQTYRQQQAVDGFRQNQTNVRSLYGQAQDESGKIGASAYKRIDDNYNKANATAQNDLTTRGLNNSTITSAVSRGLGRDAEDQRQQVDEAGAQRNMGIKLGLADQENATTSSIASTLTGLQYNDPSVGTALGGTIKNRTGGSNSAAAMGAAGTIGAAALLAFA